jgi:CheY-like chemotaxis protein
LPEILVVDDNPTHLSVREAVLRGAGFSVVTAYSAEQALDILKDRAISKGLRAILTDHVLPGASGTYSARAAKSQTVRAGACNHRHG